MSNVTLKELLSKSPEEVSEFLSGIYEHSPWVSQKLVTDDPNYSTNIQTISDLALKMKIIVDDASQEQKLELLKSHPDLCEKAAAVKELTKESQEEQSNAGLQTLTEEELTKFTTLNDKYKTKFQFPFILAVRGATKYTVLSALEGRVSNPVPHEFVTAIQQVHKIAWMRLLSKIKYATSDSKGFLTCHVLDTANGCPANNMRIRLDRIAPKESAGVVGTFVTNDDGRLSTGPALKGVDFLIGTYEWTFYVGDYFASKGTQTSGTPFLDVVPLRFGIDNPDDHYHVPLLVSPWSYSTYRGS